jgi:anti-anti-sigma regulatory factor
VADTNDAATGASARAPDPSGRDVLVVAVSRRVDVDWVAEVVGRMDLAVAPLGAIVCDLAAATACDAAALGALARVALAARRRGLRVWVRNPRPELVELVELVGLDQVLPVWPDAGGGERDPPAA